ncbi:MAG: hypothetical protein Q7R67_00040, partial [bacterium]|nr:hypothetical protein [bacterium]
MPQAHKHSFLITLGLIFLLPIFFIPGGALSLLSAKSALLTLGVIVALLTFIYEVWQSKTLRLPKHHFLVVVMLLPVLYALSAVLSTPSSLSLFGYSFEVGTFGSMLLGALLLILISTIFSDTSRILTALSAVFVSFSIIALFAGIKVVFGPSTLLGVNNMGNPLGNWTDLSMACGLLALFSALTLGMIPLKLSARILLYVVFALSTILLAVVHFGTALIFTLIASILLALYFAKVEKQFLNIGHIGPMKPIVLPIILAVVCLIFLVNPVVTKGGTKLGDIVADTFNITNTDVRPSFSATLGISKAVLSQAGLFGSGPNTFGHDWLIYKPATVNGTPFWGVAFPFGAGFVPTQIASTGILGTALWLAFFALLIALIFKAISHMPESRASRFVLVSSLFLSVFLWAASFLYAPSLTMLMLAFAFSGLLVASLCESGLLPVRHIDLAESVQTRFVSLFLFGVVVVGALGLGWIGGEKTVSAYYFKKAVDLSNASGTPLVDIENQLIKAIQFAPADI